MSNYCKPTEISINPRVTNSITTYEHQAEKSTVAWYQSGMRALI